MRRVAVPLLGRPKLRRRHRSFAIQRHAAAAFSVDATGADSAFNSAADVGAPGRRARRRALPDDGLQLSQFVASAARATEERPVAGGEGGGRGSSCNDPGPAPVAASLDKLRAQMLNEEGGTGGRRLKFHLKTYGCQMNVSDSDIVRSVLLGAGGADGTRYEETHDEMDADVLLTNTCAIRENAESKVWHRLRELRARDAKFPLEWSSAEAMEGPRRKRVIGVLGCMAERLKEDMFKDGTADLIAGPDAYRDLPRLISTLSPWGLSSKDIGGAPSDDDPVQGAINVQLSLDETYADVTPVRANPGEVSAFVSVMRGCNNMCSYCVVPFTRGRERSRELESIVAEATSLYQTERVKEVVLLGQNVNSYHDKSDGARLARPSPEGLGRMEEREFGYRTSNDGFTNMFKLRGGAGYYFADLVEAVSDISPEVRVRFTSPHPKDYPPELLQLMADRPNVCNQLHMPAQSGSSSVLQRMRRGYTREAYLTLLDDVRATIPDVAISSDFISGFCGETEEEHRDTLDLMGRVAYDQAYMFAYSMRGKTHAHRSMTDDVPIDVKMRRLNEVIKLFRTKVQERNDATEVGRIRLVLVEGESKRSRLGHRGMSGRTDQNKRIIFPVDSDGTDVEEDRRSLSIVCWSEEEIRPLVQVIGSRGAEAGKMRLPRSKVPLRAGDYAAVLVTEARGHTLRGHALWKATLTGFNEMQGQLTDHDKRCELSGLIERAESHNGRI